MFHVIHAKFSTRHKRSEQKGALMMQMAFRCYRARCKHFDLRCVTQMSVLKFSSAMPFHGPAKALEFRMVNFWMTDVNNFAEMRVEMKNKEAICEVWIQSSTHSCCPKWVSISCVEEKKDKNYRDLIVRKELLQVCIGLRLGLLLLHYTGVVYFYVD